jgi:hypothetical protein
MRYLIEIKWKKGVTKQNINNCKKIVYKISFTFENLITITVSGDFVFAEIKS